MVRMAGIVLIGMMLGTGPAAAQSPCGETVIVVYLDTLGEIADRCETTVEAMLRANPGIADPDRIYVGQTLRVPPEGSEAAAPGVERGTAEESDWQGEVQIEPESGPPGTEVRVRASGFPPGAALDVGAGPDRSEYRIVERDVRAGESGGVTLAVTLPESAEAGEAWRFVVETDGRGRRGRSPIFRVEDPEGGAPAEQSPERTTYTVRPGDTLAEIAAAFDTTVEELLSANPGIEDPDLIYVGMEVRLPSGGDASS